MLTTGLRWAPDTLPMARMIGHHHQAGRHHRRRPADRAGERRSHHGAAGRHQHEEERPDQLGEQPAPLLRGIVEVLDHPDQALLGGQEGEVAVTRSGGHLAPERVGLRLGRLHQSTSGPKSSNGGGGAGGKAGRSGGRRRVRTGHPAPWKGAP